MEEEGKKIIGKRMQGLVVSDRAEKTAVVSVTRFFKHKRYGKYIRMDKKYKAHNEESKYKMGDKVIIEECRPLSKDKHFKIVGYISK